MSPGPGAGTPLHLVLGLDLDGGTPWRHLVDRPRAGWEAIGPSGLLRRLGTILGTHPRLDPLPVRAAWIAGALATIEDGKRSWSASYPVDPWGVALRVLKWRDSLRKMGWDGRPLTGSPRLDDLSIVEEALVPGGAQTLEDGIDALLEDLDTSGLPVTLRLELVDPREDLPPRLADLVDALQNLGAEIIEGQQTGNADPDTDLGQLQRALATGAHIALQGDGTVALLEAQTPWEAAVLATAYATRTSGGHTVVVGPQGAVLEAVRDAHGVPSLGLPHASAARPVLQVLPLRLQLAFAPGDPEHAAELLTLPDGPLLAARVPLMRALADHPSLGGPPWQQAIDAACTRASEAARKRAEDHGLPERAIDRLAQGAARHLRGTIATWLGGRRWDPATGIPPVEAAALCAEVAEWHAGLSNGDDPHAAAAGQAARMRRTLQALQPGVETLRPGQLSRILDTVVGEGLRQTTRPGQAGRPAVALRPAATLPAELVTWWGFIDDPDDEPPAQPWSPAELEALRRAGLRPPGPGATRMRQAHGWRRPILAASRGLTLVSWRSAGTEATDDHPFMDELRARADLSPVRIAMRELVTGARSLPWWQPPLREAVSHTLPRPQHLWLVPADLLKADSLTVTATETLLRCPLRWALGAAGIRPGPSALLPDGDRLVGSFAHAVIEEVFVALPQPMPAPQEVARLAGKAFDERVAAEAAPLARPGREVGKRWARRTVTRAAEALAAAMITGGWHVEDTEREVAGTLGDTAIRGRLDLLLRNAAGGTAILDLKLGGAPRLSQALANGTAVQLALYAVALGDPMAPTGYFVLGEGQTLSTDEDAFPGSQVDGPSTAKVLRNAQKKLARWTAVMAEGGLFAPRRGRTDDPRSRQVPTPPPISFPWHPPCEHCPYDSLCIDHFGRG